MTVETKICGLSTSEGIEAAVAGGASYIGFVFFPRSPRSVTPEQAAGLRALVPRGVAVVALMVNPDDALVTSVLEHVAPDMIQLHGAETPERVAEIKALTSLPVMKAVAIAGQDDVERALGYAGTADRLLLDAKPPKDRENALPGGNGVTFDWRLIEGREWPLPWMLSGGLTAENVAEAVRLTGAAAVDVSSGVEKAPGIKDAALIGAFLESVRDL